MKIKVFHIGKFRISISNNWDKKRKYLKIIDFVLDFDYHFINITIFNFDIEFDWSWCITK